MSPKEKIERKLAAIVFTDIVSFTQLSAKNEPAALKLLDKQRDTLKPIVAKHNGSWLKEIGDGLLLAFNTNMEAVNCSIAIQNAVKNIDDLNLRIGIHNGEVVFQDNDVVGDDVNIASRIEPFSAPGGIAISDRINASLERDPDFITEYIGLPLLKGVTQEIKIYCITSHGLPETDISQVSAKLEPEKKFKWDIFSVSGLALSIIGVMFWVSISVLGIGVADEEEVPSVAILPLDNKGATDDDFYAYGISSDLISDVASAGLIRVASLKKIEELGDITSDEKASQLDVRYIAEGTLWRRDSIFQLSMELYDTHTEKVVWSQRWQKNWTEISGIRDELAKNILDKLEVVQQNNRQSYAANPEAYEYYLKAKHKYEKQEDSENKDIAIGLLNKAIELDKNLIEARILLGSIYSGKKDYDLALQIFELALEQSEQIGDKLWAGRSIRKIGVVYYFKGEKDNALEIQEKALQIAEGINDKMGMAHCLSNIGSMIENMEEFEKALEYRNKSYQLYKDLDAKFDMGKSLIFIGACYNKMGDYEKALEIYIKSFKVGENSGENIIITNSLSNIGNLYKRMGNFNKLIEYRKRILVVQQEQDQKKYIMSAYSQLGWAFFTQGLYDQSTQNYNNALLIAEELKDNNEVLRLFINLGLSHFHNKSYDKALDYFENVEKLQTDNSTSEIFIQLTKKMLNQEFDTSKILSLIENPENIRNYFIDLFGLYKLLEDSYYLEKSYDDVRRKSDGFTDEFKEIYLNYPVQKQIIDEYNKMFS
jgi:class 3 adenylate cyclase/tetratricopeptide (TPR) repeat protein